MDRFTGFLDANVPWLERASCGTSLRISQCWRLYHRALARIVEQGPIPAVHGVVRWRRKDLALWIFEEFGISLEVSSVGREPRAMGFRKMTARPRHKGQNEYALDDFKKNSQARWSRSGQRSRPART